MPAAERTQFLEKYEAWKAAKNPKLDEEKEFQLQHARLSNEDHMQLAEWVENKVDDTAIKTTFGDKVYVTFESLEQDLPQMAAEFIAIGEELLKWINQQLPETNKMLRLKRQCLVLLTYGPNTQRGFDFREGKKQKRRKGKRRPKITPPMKGQLPHTDAPSVPRGLPAGVEAFYSAFYTMTPRSSTSMYFDMTLDELLDGKTWGEDAETNKWILWQLMFAHMFAFEIQATKNEAAVKNGEWEVSEPGRVDWFRPGSRWHAGNVGLNQSTLPEVVLLFEFAWWEIADFFANNFNDGGGFGQHPWDDKVAESQLKEVQKHTFNMSQITAPPPGGPAPPAQASGTLKFEGEGVSSITLEQGWAYLIREVERNALFVHKTGPNKSIGGDVDRLVIIISGHFPGDPTVSEHGLLRKGSYLSNLYHYRYKNQGVAREAPSEKEVEYIQEVEQVRAEDLIDTKSTEVPEIPHGPLSMEIFKRLRQLARGVRNTGKLIIFSKFESGMEHETSENKANLKEAYENMINWPFLSDSQIVEYNDHQRKDQRNPQSPTVRSIWNTIARAMAKDLRVPGAEGFHVFSVRIVKEAALRYHLDQKGLGPSVMVGVLTTKDAYKVLFAKVKQGPPVRRSFFIVCPEVFCLLFV
jgi:hypothetical protein